MKKSKIMFGITCAVMAAAAVLALYYFTHVAEMVTSHTDSYTVFPVLYGFLSLLPFSFCLLEKQEDRRWLHTVTGISLLVLAVLCILTASRIPCCTGG